MANEKFRDSTLSPAERAADLLSRLTLREKVGQVIDIRIGFRSYVRTGDAVELAEDFKREVERWGGLGVLYGLYRADPWADKDYATVLRATRRSGRITSPSSTSSNIRASASRCS